jgi:hypothetical protein
MIFCRTGRIVAVLILVFSLIQAAMGLLLAPGDPDQMQAVVRHFGSTPGKMIDRGVYGFLAAIALGALSEIGLSLKALANNPRT